MSWLLTGAGQLRYDGDATGIEENLKEGITEAEARVALCKLFYERGKIY